MLFGTSKDITLGPTAILSLLTASLTEPCGDQDSRIACAMALTFLSGAIQLAVGLVNLGECLVGEGGGGVEGTGACVKPMHPNTVDFASF